MVVELWKTVGAKNDTSSSKSCDSAVANDGFICMFKMWNGDIPSQVISGHPPVWDLQNEETQQSQGLQKRIE